MTDYDRTPAEDKVGSFYKKVNTDEKKADGGQPAVTDKEKRNTLLALLLALGIL